MFKKAEADLEILTDINVLLMIEKGIKGGINHAIHKYAETSNKHVKNYDKNKELS